MKAVRVFGFPGVGDRFVGRRCTECGTKLEAGDVALVVDQGRDVYVHKELVWHRRCVQKVLDAAPMDQTEILEIFEEIRSEGGNEIRRLLDA